MPGPTSGNRNETGPRLPLSIGALLATLLLLSTISAPSQDVRSPENQHAVLQYEGDRLIKLSVTGAWPAEQIVNRLRREYGWAIDIEMAPQAPALLQKNGDGKSSPRMRFVAVKIPRPADPASTEERVALDALAKGFSQNGQPTRVIQNGSDRRYDLIPKVQGAPLLSTAIKLPVKARSVDETVTDILDQVRTVTGQPIVRGGLFDPGPTQVQVTLGGELPARVLLAQALNALPYVEVWSLNFDPHEGTYAFALDTATRATTSRSGTILLTPIRSTHDK